jgi:hypothetical protein
MRVNYTFHDKTYGDFIIDAEVSGSGRVQIITIEDDHGTDVDFDDFTPEEKQIIVEMAKVSRDDLDRMPDAEEPDEDEDE